MSTACNSVYIGNFWSSFLFFLSLYRLSDNERGIWRWSQEFSPTLIYYYNNNRCIQSVTLSLFISFFQSARRCASYNYSSQSSHIHTYKAATAALLISFSFLFFCRTIMRLFRLHGHQSWCNVHTQHFSFKIVDELTKKNPNQPLPPNPLKQKTGKEIRTRQTTTTTTKMEKPAVHQRQSVRNTSKQPHGLVWYSHHPSEIHHWSKNYVHTAQQQRTAIARLLLLLLP